MDELNLYDDLDEFQEQQEKKSKELQEVEEKYQQSLATIEDLHEENKKLKKNIKRIELGFQSLLDTARSEIKRKDKEIERLRKEKDDICFRRKTSSNSANTNENSHLIRNSTINPFRHNIKDHEISLKGKNITVTTFHNKDEQLESNKRNRSDDDEREYKRQCSTRNYHDSKYRHGSYEHAKTPKTVEEDHGVSRARNRDNNKEYTSKVDSNRNHNLESRETEKTSRNTYEKFSKSSHSLENYSKSTHRSRSRERDKDGTKNRKFDRNRSRERKHTHVFSKASSKSPQHRNKIHADINRDHCKSQKMFRTTENGKSQVISDKDLGEENNKNLAAANSRKEIPNETVNENKNSEIVAVDILNKQSLNEEAQKMSYVTIKDKERNKPDKKFDDESENNIQPEVTAVDSSTTDTSKLCTPRRVALFDEIFGKSPSECNPNPTSSTNSNSLLINIKDIIAKAAQFEVISSATTSPTNYTDGNSCMSTPINKTIEITSSSSNTPNNTLNVDNAQTTVLDEIDECFIPNRKLAQVVETTACVDLTKVVEDDIATEVDFIHIPGLDLCLQREQPINTNASIQIEEHFKTNVNEISKEKTETNINKVATATESVALNEETTIQATNTNNNIIEVEDIENNGTENEKQSASVEIGKTMKYNKQLGEKINEETESFRGKERNPTNLIKFLNSKANLEQQANLESNYRNAETSESFDNLHQTQDTSTSKITSIENISFEEYVQRAEKVKHLSDKLINKVVFLEAIKYGGILPLKNPYKTDQDENANKTTIPAGSLIDTNKPFNGSNLDNVAQREATIGDKSKANEGDKIESQTKSIHLISSVDDEILIDGSKSKKEDGLQETVNVKTGVNAIKALYHEKENILSEPEKQIDSAEGSCKPETVEVLPKIVSSHITEDVKTFEVIAKDKTTGKIMDKENSIEKKSIHEHKSGDIVEIAETFYPAKAVQAGDENLFSIVAQESLSKLSETSSQKEKSLSEENLARFEQIPDLLTQAEGVQIEKADILSTTKQGTSEESISVKETYGIVKTVETFSPTKFYVGNLSSISEQGASPNVPESTYPEEKSLCKEMLEESVNFPAESIDVQIEKVNLLSTTEQRTSCRSPEKPAKDDRAIEEQKSNNEKTINEIVETVEVVEDVCLPSSSAKEHSSKSSESTQQHEESLSEEKLDEIIQTVELPNHTKYVGSEKESHKNSHSIEDVCYKERQSNSKEQLDETVKTQARVVQVEKENVSSITEQRALSILSISSQVVSKLSECSPQAEESLREKQFDEILQTVDLPAKAFDVQIASKHRSSSTDQGTSSDSSEKSNTDDQANTVICSEEIIADSKDNLDEIVKTVEMSSHKEVAQAEEEILSPIVKQGTLSKLFECTAQEEDLLNAKKSDGIETGEHVAYNSLEKSTNDSESDEFVESVELNTQHKALQIGVENILSAIDQETPSEVIVKEAIVVDLQHAIIGNTAPTQPVAADELLTESTQQIVENEQRNLSSPLELNTTTFLSEIKHTSDKDRQNNVTYFKTSQETIENSAVKVNKAEREAVFKDINSEEGTKFKNYETTEPNSISTDDMSDAKNKSSFFESLKPEANKNEISATSPSFHCKETKNCNNNDVSNIKVTMTEDGKNGTQSLDSCHSPILKPIRTKYITAANSNDETNIESHKESKPHLNVTESSTKDARNKSSCYESITPEANKDYDECPLTNSSRHSRDTKACNNNDESTNKVTLTEDSKNGNYHQDSYYPAMHEAIMTDYDSKINEIKTKSNVAKPLRKSPLKDFKNITTKLNLHDPALVKANTDLTTTNIGDLNSIDQTSINSEISPTNVTNKRKVLSTNKVIKYESHTVKSLHEKLNNKNATEIDSNPVEEPTNNCKTELGIYSEQKLQNDTNTYKEIARLEGSINMITKDLKNIEKTQVNDISDYTLKESLLVSEECNKAAIKYVRSVVEKENVINDQCNTDSKSKQTAKDISSVNKSTEDNDPHISNSFTEENPVDSIELRGNLIKEFKIIDVQLANKNGNEANGQDSTKEMTPESTVPTITRNKESEITIKPKEINGVQKYPVESFELKGNLIEKLNINEESTHSQDRVKTFTDIKNNMFMKKIVTKEINIEGEIVEVVKNIVDLNDPRNSRGNIDIIKQNSDISHKTEYSLEGEQEQDAGSFDHKISQSKFVISETEFKRVDKFEKQTPSIVVKPTNPQYLQAQIQTKFASEADISPTRSLALPETYNTTAILPSISTTSPTPSNFSGIFSKKVSPVNTVEDESIKSKKKSPHFSVKHKEYILPAASVLCNVDNLKNATKSIKKLHWELLDNKNEMTEIEDDADIDKTDDEQLHIKEEPLENASNSPKENSLDKKLTHTKLQKSSPSETDTQTEDESPLNYLRQQRGNSKKFQKSKVQKIKQHKPKLSKNVNAESLISIESPLGIALHKKAVETPKKQDQNAETNNKEITLQRKKKGKTKKIEQNLTLQQKLPGNVLLNRKFDNCKEIQIEVKGDIQKTKAVESNKLESFDVQSNYYDAGNRRDQTISPKSLKSGNCVLNNIESFDDSSKNVPKIINSMKSSLKILSSSVEKPEISAEPTSSKDSLNQRPMFETQVVDYANEDAYHASSNYQSSTNDIYTSVNENRPPGSYKQLEEKENCQLTQFLDKSNVSPKSPIRHCEVTLSSKETQDINLANENNCDRVCIAGEKSDASIVKDKVMDNNIVLPITDTLPSSINVAVQENSTISRSDSETKEVLSGKQEDVARDCFIDSKSLTKPLLKKKYSIETNCSKNKVSHFISLQDIGIKVPQHKVHLSSFRIPKISKNPEETIDNSWKLEAYVELETKEDRKQSKQNIEQKKKDVNILQEKQQFKEEHTVNNPPKEHEETGHFSSNNTESDKINEVKQHKIVKLSEEKAKTSTSKIGKRKLFNSELYDKRDTRANFKSAVDNNCSETSSDQQDPFPSQTHETNLVKLRRKSVHVTNSDLSNNSPKTCKQFITNLHEKILDSSSEQCNNNEVETNQEKLPSNKLSKIKKTFKLEAISESSLKAQRKSSVSSTNTPKVRRKSMYAERSTNAAVETADKADTNIITDLKFSVEQKNATKLTEIVNKNSDNQEPMQTIKSLKMRKKLMHIQSTSLNITSPELEQVTNKSCTQSNLKACNKSSNNHETELLSNKDANPLTLSENRKQTCEQGKPITSFKMRKKSMCAERNILYNKEDKNNAIQLKKSKHQLEKKAEESIVEQNTTQQMLPCSNFSVATEQQNSIKTHRKSKNIDRELLNIPDPTNDSVESLDVHVKRKHDNGLNIGNTQQTNTISVSSNILPQQSVISMRRKSVNQRRNKDNSNKDNNNLNSQDDNKNSKELKTSKQETEKNTKELRFDINNDQKTNAGNDSAIVKIQHQSVETLNEQNSQSNEKVVIYARELDQVSKLHNSEALDKKSIKMCGKSTNKSHTLDSRSILKRDLGKLTDNRKHSSDPSSIVLTQAQYSKIHDSSRALNVELGEISTQKHTNPGPSYNLRTKLDSTSKLTHQKDVKVRRKSTNQCENSLNLPDANVPNTNDPKQPQETTEDSELKREADSDTSVIMAQEKTIRMRRKSINQRRILDSSSDDDEPLVKRTAVIPSEVEIPLTPVVAKPKQHKRRVVKVLSTSYDSPTNARNSSQQSSSPLTSPNHPIFNTEVSIQSTEFVASLPITPNQQDDNKFKEIDSKLHEIFQSPIYTADYKISSTVAAPDLPISSSSLNEFLPNVTIDETLAYDRENCQSSLNVSQVNESMASLNDTAAVHNNSEIKHLSLGSAEYRFEKVSDNVINLFISRKRKRKRNN